MSYQQQGNGGGSSSGGPSYSHIPGLSVGAVPIHYANASDGPSAGNGDGGDQDDQYYYGGEYGGGTPMGASTYGGYNANGGSGMGFGGGSGGFGGTVGGIFSYIRSNRPLSLGIGFFLIMLFLTGGGGGSSGDDGAEPPTIVSNNNNAPAPVPAASSSTSATPAISGGGGGSSSGQQDSVRGQETSRFSGGNGANNNNNNNNINNNNPNAATTTAFTDGEIPRGITWLSYFPLSGAYYVSLVVKALGVPTGTNYNNAKSADMRVPLFEKSPQGPFARGTFHGPNEGDGTVLVSTHCGGTCPLTVASFTSHHICQPYEFIENVLSFDEACRSTYYYDIATKRDEKGVYDSHYVERMIHLIRDPLANVVSMSRVGPSNSTGFHALCAASSKSAAAAAAATTSEVGAVAGANMMNRFIPSDVKAAMDGVPCPYEFFQYIQWHNLALEEAEFRGLDTLPIYYEDFGRQQDEMVGGIADFLGVPKNSKKRKEVPQFLRARMYDDYYTAEQKRAIWRLIETMALPKTLELLQRYRSG